MQQPAERRSGRPAEAPERPPRIAYTGRNPCVTASSCASSRHVTESLRALLERARNASPGDRIDLRDDIADHGAAAVEPLREWLTDSDLSRFAVRVLGKLADKHDREIAVAALREARDGASAEQWADIAAELRRLGALQMEPDRPTDRLDDKLIRDRLVAAAKRRELVYYADLAGLLGREMRGRNWAAPIYHALDRINDDEDKAGRPMLSAIVVAKDTKLPGPGFFALGQRLGKTRPGEDEEAFAKRARADVYAFWADEGNDPGRT